MATEPTPAPSPSPAPSGGSGAVTAVAVVNYVLGVLQLVCGGCVAFGGSALTGLAGQMGQQNPNLDPEAAEAFEQMAQVGGGLIIVLGIAYLVFGLLLLVAGYGVMKRQSWGRTLTLVLGGIAAILAILGLVGGEWFGAVTNLAYAVLVFAVLLNRENAAEFVR